LAKFFAWEGRIAVMYLGQIVEIGKTQNLIADPQHPYTRVLLSAIPEADPDKTRNKRHIRLRSEDIPRLTELPSGCTFHPRCPWFIKGICDREVPVLGNVPGSPTNTEVACIPLTRGHELTLYES
jgi:peptide/nickel transport system ATP-binding protein